MDGTQATDIANRLREAARSGRVTELKGTDARDFVFVDDVTARPFLTGSFQVDVPGGRPFFVAIVCGANHHENFQVFVMEKRKGSPLLGTSRVSPTNLLWRYNPTKQSGDNAKRKAEFIRLAGADTLSLPLPEENIEPFATAITRALALRRKADEAGGPSDDSAELDDGAVDGASFWKISPGEGGNEWKEWREGGFAAIGWKELGDLTGFDEPAFERRTTDLKEKHAWRAGGSQAWKFRNIKVGDGVIANAGTKRVLGRGVVTRAYHFVEGADHPHHLGIKWEDTVERVIDMSGWRRTLIRLTESVFNELKNASPVAGSLSPTSPPIAAPSGGIDFDGVLAQLESKSLTFPPELVAAYLLALQARRFVLITGISGTGKTQLALEVARLFSPRSSPAPPADDETQLLIRKDTLKNGRFVIPSSLARDFDVLYEEGVKRLDVELLGRAKESMSVYKDAARANLLLISFSGEAKRTFQTALTIGERLVLRREVNGDDEWLVATRSSGAPSAGAATYEMVAVRPDWTDARALLGFYNPLTQTYQRTPTLNLLLRAAAEVDEAAAAGRPPRPFFVIFDEMNLARVEHYFSDFLSAMESGEELPLHQDDQEAEDGVPQRFRLPPNLFVVGTVNVDETTYMFSPKVLDRAFVLEFNDVNLSFLSGAVSADKATPLALSKMEDGLKLLGAPDTEEWTLFEAMCGGRLRRALQAIHDVLAAHNRHFGYRVAREVARFVWLAAQLTDGSDEALVAAFDIAILAKVLPKLSGTQAELDVALGDIAALFDGAPPAEGAIAGSPFLLRTSAKLVRMRRKLQAQGFVSFVE